MSEIFRPFFIYIVMLCSISLCIEDSDDIYHNDKQLLFFERNNLSVVIEYDEFLDHLQFHFNWDDSLHEFLIVTLTHIPSTNTSIHCGVDIEETIYGPDYFLGSRDELNFGCTYLITVNDSFESLSFNYSIPYCVDGKCDCNHFPLPMNITVEYQRKDEFLIEWIFGNPQDEAVLVNVTFISYVIENCGDFSASQYTLMEPKYKLLDSNNSALIFTENHPHICLLITFTNKFGCPERYLRRLEVIKQDVSPWLNISYTFILVIILLVIIALWYIDKCRGTIKALLISRFLNRRRRNHNIYSYATETTKKIETNNLLYIESEILEGEVDEFEFPRNHLKLLYEIGKGAFGEVYLGNALVNGKEESVAVKTLREKSSIEEVEDFRAEIDIMKKIGQHPNIVTMLKCCTLHEPFMMIMEYVPYGDLKHYLMNLRDKWKKKLINYNDDVYNGSGMYINPNSPRFEKTKKPSTSTEYTNLSTTPTPTSLDQFTFDVDQSSLLDHTELQHFALQIACGMAHLEKIPITHRDLAARNILIDANKVLKISDFGLSRPGPYINKSHNKLPLRWMALEAIEEHIYDNKSDVWSFGVVLWEIGTLGAFPYDTIPDRMLLYHLHVGKRLERPEICTDELYSLMLRCWSEDPKLRPTFEELVQQLDVNKSRVYIDFAQLNPTYVFPPTSSNHRCAKKVEECQKNNDEIMITQDNVVSDKEQYLECP
nr:receptor-like tyrosine-protein kinase kin-15 [Onthophagus taurus]